MNANTATVYAITTIYVASSEFTAPYTTAILETAEGDRFLGFIDHKSPVSAGDTVAFLAWNENGNPVYSAVSPVS